jgi:hypothetical protein
MITAQVETLAGGGLDELKPLLPGHYEELSLHRGKGFKLNPRYDDYLNREAQGQVLYVTLRKSGNLIGYFVGHIVPGLHYQDCLTLHSDIYYVVPEHRGDGAGLVLFNAVKKELKRRGGNLWMSGDKEFAHMHTGKLHQAIGFEKVENVYALWMD